MSLCRFCTQRLPLDVCFDTRHPVSLGEVDFYLLKTFDKQKHRRRIGSLHPGHERIAPYARHLRVILFKDLNHDMIDKSVSLCTRIARVPSQVILRCEGGQKQVEALRHAFFTEKPIRQVRLTYTGLPWPIQYQIEALASFIQRRSWI
jgi:RNA-dependent RNA polymerase